MSLWYNVIKPLKFIVSTGYKAVHIMWYNCMKINKTKLIWRKILESLILKNQQRLFFNVKWSHWNYFCIALVFFFAFSKFFLKGFLYWRQFIVCPVMSRNGPVESTSSALLCITSYITGIQKLWGKNKPKQLQSKIDFNSKFT